jgi:hypothetical protein
MTNTELANMKIANGTLWDRCDGTAQQTMVGL